MTYHGYLERFAIIGQVVVLEGWANALELELHYADAPLTLSVTRVRRPELVAGLGADAEDWGFVACAALPAAHVDRTKFTVKFNAGLSMTDPGSRFRAPEDVGFDAMTAKFRETVAGRSGARLLEIGSRARSGAIYRSWFPADMHYTGIDITSGPNVDIVGDAHHLTRHVDQRFDFMFSIAVFEHILMPWKVAIEMNKVLEPGGQALIISHAAWPLHEEPWDFFRFSKDAWRGIFNRHTGFEIIDAQYQYPASIIPQYACSVDTEQMGLSRTYLLSGCVVRKAADAVVAWDAEASDVYDLNYSHG